MSIRTTRTTESSDRIAALRAAKTASTKTTLVRFSHTANRILNALMRTLATPHI